MFHVKIRYDENVKNVVLKQKYISGRQIRKQNNKLSSLECEYGYFPNTVEMVNGCVQQFSLAN